ncbi:MAG: permease [Rhodobacteraceae bacterium]|nr:permease [Paracoccaceae bacterium]
MTDITQQKPAFRPTLKSPWTVSLGLLILVAIFDLPNLGAVSLFAVMAFLSTLKYIVFAVFLIAALKAAGAEAVVANAFKGREIRMIFVASLFGGLAPFCSCEVIPFISGLLILGAPLSAVMAFWLSSPLIDPPTLFITAGALGWDFAIAKAIAAVSLGIFGGFVVKFFARGGAFANPLKPSFSQGCGCGPSPLTGTPVWAFWTEVERRETFKHEFITNAFFLAKWLAMAYVLEALLVSYIPSDMIVKVVGGEGLWPIVTAALVGMPAYLNSYVAPPLLAGLTEQGMSPGAAMSFMIAGAVSSVPAMAAVWSLVRPQIFALYLGLGVTGAIVAGVIFQQVT